jgi:hypothetical protein
MIAKHTLTRRHLLAGSSALALSALAPGRAFAAAFDPFAAPVSRGPSSLDVPAIGATASASGAPYLAPVAEGWRIVSLLTTGDEVKGYHLAGIPDGLGAFDNGDGTITILCNHELAGGKGAVRGHGGKGAFVSRWTLAKDSLEIRSGQDFVTSPQKMHLFAGDGWKSGDQVPAKQLDFSRFCSADLAPVSAFFNKTKGLGYNGHIFLNGEEAGVANPNRAFAWVAEDGAGWELPAFGFGKAGDAKDPTPSWENLLAHPATGDLTLVAANSDGGSNQVYFYIGRKAREGSPIERAGLTGGTLFSMVVPGVAIESRDTNIGIAKSLAGKGAGRAIAFAEPNKGTSFLRPEDGAWDTRNPNRYYFVTTDRNNFEADGTVREGQDVKQIARSRLWAVTFDDVTKLVTDGAPTGKIELLLDGTEGGEMFDNVTVTADGVIFLCEDPGNSRHNGKVWAYELDTGKLEIVAKFDPAKFGDVVGGQYTPPVAPFVDDKETSGVLDVTDLFKDAPWFRPKARVLLIVVQAHFEYDLTLPAGAQLVEGGQMLLMVKAG